MASSGSREKVELTTRNSLVKMPKGGRPAIATTPTTRVPAERRMAFGQAADLGDPLRALDPRDVSDAEEDRRLGQAVHRHVQQAGEIRERPAHAEGEGDDAHMLDRRVGEEAFDVAAAVEHEGREHHRRQAHRHHQRPRRDRLAVRGQQDLEAQHGVERDVEQQARRARPRSASVLPRARPAARRAAAPSPTFVP